MKKRQKVERVGHAAGTPGRYVVGYAGGIIGTEGIIIPLTKANAEALAAERADDIKQWTSDKPVIYRLVPVRRMRAKRKS